MHSFQKLDALSTRACTLVRWKVVINLMSWRGGGFNCSYLGFKKFSVFIQFPHMCPNLHSARFCNPVMICDCV